MDELQLIRQSEGAFAPLTGPGTQWGAGSMFKIMAPVGWRIEVVKYEGNTLISISRHQEKPSDGASSIA